VNKAWGILWLVVAWCIALSIITSLLAPYLWIIAVIVLVGGIVFVGINVWRFFASRRSHF